MEMDQAVVDYEVARQRHLQAMIAQVRGEVEKVTWPLERLHALRNERLRALLRVAKERSPWHARRLRGIDPEQVTGDDLSGIPPMSKADLMANWDEIVTDRRVTLEMTRRHLVTVAERGPAYLLDEFHVVTTGGSTGVFLWDWEGWLQAGLGSWRHIAWLVGALQLTGPPRSATIAAEHAIHMTEAMRRTFEPGASCLLPVTMPLPEIVRGLNEFQPVGVLAYPSMLHRLALEAEAGRLSISPRLLFCGAEPLYAHMRGTIEAALGAPVVNTYACSEGWMIGCSYPGAPAIHMVEDVAVYEPVDREGRPVPAGERASKLLLTNVINHALPLIRYELTDEVTFLGEPNPGPWTGRRIAAVEGRLDDLFVYADRGRGEVVAHPYIFWSALGRDPRIVEYQVRQTEAGAGVAVQLAGAMPLEPVREKLVEGLRRVGLSDPVIDIETVDTMERLPGSGKVRRFIPLGA
jgi:phenylacetate-coenzyme A ligase PaaK-like adenylate-forming protein